MGALPACLSVFQFRRKCVPRKSQPLRLCGTVMVSQNSVSGQESVMRATALVRPGVVIVARTCKSKICSHITFVVCWKTTLKSGKTISGALVVALLCSTDNSSMRLLASKGVPREAKVQEKQHGRKKRSENGALTRAGAASYFLEHTI